LTPSPSPIHRTPASSSVPALVSRRHLQTSRPSPASSRSTSSPNSHSTDSDSDDDSYSSRQSSRRRSPVRPLNKYAGAMPSSQGRRTLPLTPPSYTGYPTPQTEEHRDTPLRTQRSGSFQRIFEASKGMIFSSGGAAHRSSKANVRA
ncbi:hypothetical protein P7C70_g7152, partial [Phenoliferia sp. Uapishka_3]